MDSIIEKDNEVGEAWAKTADKIDKENKEATKTTNKLAESMIKLAETGKTLDKNIVGGAYKKFLNELREQVGLTNKEIIKYIENAKKSTQAAIFSLETQEEVEEAKIAIEILNTQLKELVDNEEEVDLKTQTLRQRLIEVKNELHDMAAAGNTGSEQFQELQKEAIAITKQIDEVNKSIRGLAKGTRTLDGLISIASGVAGGFAVAQGAAALFGEESENVQKALLKVNAAMAILQGLQQIQNVLQKESAAMLLLSTVRTNALSVSQQFLAATTMKTTAATIALRGVLLTTGIGALIGLAGLLASAFSDMGDEAKDAAMDIDILKAALDGVTDLSDYYLENISKKTDLLIEKAKQRGASDAEIYGLEQKRRGQEKGELEEHLKYLQGKYQEEANSKVTSAKNLAEINNRIVAQQKKIKDKEFEIELEAEKNKTKLAKEGAANSSQSSLAAAEAEIARRRLAIIQNEVDTIKSINAVTDAEINAINVRRDEQLKSDKITAGERLKINADADLQIAQLKNQQQQQLLEVEKSVIDAQLLLAQKGSEEELELKLKSIEKQREVELSATELTQEQVNNIKAKSQKEALEAQRVFNESQIQNTISYLTSALDEFDISEERKLSLTLKRLQKQRELEISQADGNAAKIQEINAKYDKESLEAKKASIKAQLAEELKAYDVFNERLKRYNEKVVANELSTYNQRKKASEKILKIELDRLDKEAEALKKQLTKRLISQEEYNVKYQEILNRRVIAHEDAEEKMTAITIREIEKRAQQIQDALDVFQKGLFATMGTNAFSVAIAEIQNFGSSVFKVLSLIKEGVKSTKEGIQEIVKLGVGAAQEIINQSFADASSRRQQDLEEHLTLIDAQKQKELDNKNLTEQQKADIDAKYRQREKQEKIKAFEADKQAKKEQAGMNAALAITQALATNPFPYSLIVSAIIAASTALQINRINNARVPRFKRGQVDIQGPGTPTSDSIPALISRGESVIKADATKKWKDALLAINNNRFEEYLSNRIKDFVFPEIPDGETRQLQFNPVEIDYNALASAIADKMKDIIPAPKSTHVSIDKNGIKTIVIEGNSQTEVKNNKYSMK